MRASIETQADARRRPGPSRRRAEVPRIVDNRYQLAPSSWTLEPPVKAAERFRDALPRSAVRPGPPTLPRRSARARRTVAAAERKARRGEAQSLAPPGGRCEWPRGRAPYDSLAAGPAIPRPRLLSDGCRPATPGRQLPTNRPRRARRASQAPTPRTPQALRPPRPHHQRPGPGAAANTMSKPSSRLISGERAAREAPQVSESGPGSDDASRGGVSGKPAAGRSTRRTSRERAELAHRARSSRRTGPVEALRQRQLGVGLKLDHRARNAAARAIQGNRRHVGRSQLACLEARREASVAAAEIAGGAHRPSELTTEPDAPRRSRVLGTSPTARRRSGWPSPYPARMSGSRPWTLRPPAPRPDKLAGPARRLQSYRSFAPPVWRRLRPTGRGPPPRRLASPTSGACSPRPRRPCGPCLSAAGLKARRVIRRRARPGAALATCSCARTGGSGLATSYTERSW